MAFTTSRATVSGGRESHPEGQDMAGSSRGYLVIADITGYTRFLTGSELEHAQGILEDLFESLTARLESPLTLSHIQGDAILAHAPVDLVQDASLVLDSVEGLYVGFRERLAHMERNTTCPCAACTNMQELDLKLLVHFGEYVEHALGGHQELSGPDVILVHRLLKNTVREETGIAAYALFTEAAIGEIGLDAAFADTRRYQFEDQDLGVIKTSVLDMGPVWERYRDQRRIVLGPDTKRFHPDITQVIEATPDVTWHYYLDPKLRPRWFVDVVKTDRQGAKNGRLSVGTKDHCAHGNGKVSINTFVDVVPHEHVTYDTALAMDCYVRASVIFEPHGSATRVTVRMAVPTGPGALRAKCVGLLGKLFFAKKVAQVWRESLQNLAALVAAEAAPPDSTSAQPTTIAGDALADLARRSLGTQDSSSA